MLNNGPNNLNLEAWQPITCVFLRKRDKILLPWFKFPVESKLFTWRIGYSAHDKQNWTLSKTSATKCQQNLRMNINLSLLKKPKINYLRYVDYNKIIVLDNKTICRSSGVSFSTRNYVSKYFFVSSFVAASQQIPSAGCLCCVYRGNLSVWIQRIRHQCSHTGNNPVFLFTTVTNQMFKSFGRINGIKSN